MTRRWSTYAVVLGVTAGTLWLPAASWAGSGATVQPGNVTVSASAGGMTITTTASAILRNQLRFTGKVPARDAGNTVEIERMGHETGWKWAITAQSQVAHDGSFAATWRTNHIGRFSIRAVVYASGASAAGASPAVAVTVYRPSVATQYGPGFWGHTTACGEVLRRQTLGVANRTLPCGTPVALYYGGQTIVVPVIDRGPYTNGVDWDLTKATAQALGIGGTAPIGAVSLPARS